jgi:hypothetical protein
MKQEGKSYVVDIYNFFLGDKWFSHIYMNITEETFL